MFIDQDEHLIVMEETTTRVFDLNDLDLLKDAGVRTILRSYSAFRDHIDIRHYKMFKVLIPFYYSRQPFEQIVREAEDVLNYTRLSLSQIKKLFPENIQLVYAIPDGGEFLWDAMRIDDYPLSDEQIIEFMLSIQRLLYEQYGEIWVTLHHYLGHPQNWNNTRLPILYQALRDAFPSAPIYSLQFAHFTCGGTPQDPELRKRVGTYRDAFGVRSFVGPDFCEGLKKNFDLALEDGAWGFIVSPIHKERPDENLEVRPWMAEIIKETNYKLKEHFK